MARSDWYKTMVVYQIWPRSFCDGNGDGIGDLYGVFSKLDYIKSLGVDAIWFSPLYPSPNADFGYDVADYRSINPEYGDLDIFKKVLDGAHERGMRVFMDLVVNHTSDEHPWFEASRDPDSPYRKYYFWRPGKKSRSGAMLPPNNWDSLFEGGAWEYDPQSGEYYLHTFAKKQPDLDHSEPAVRQEVKDIMRFWLDMGVDGFREDVITYISKTPGLPSAKVKLPAATGMEFYDNGPHVHEYLAEYRAVADEYDCMLLGEGPRLKPEKASVKATLARAVAGAYAKAIDKNIDYRRVRNLKIFFDRNASSLTTDMKQIEKWQGGDIVIFPNHIAVVSDRRNKEGIPYIIHHGGQPVYEEDALKRYKGNILGHYRIDFSKLISKESIN